jgi:nucleotide sugar dehydrogenase
MKIGIVGVGNIGFVLFKILNKCFELQLVETSLERIKWLKKENISVTSDCADIQDCSLVFIIVNTTAEQCYQYDNLIFVLKQIEKLAKIPTLVISSTCDPSFFNEIVFKNLEKKIIYSPFFVRQGCLEQDIKNPDFVLIGDNNRLSSGLCEVYRAIGVNNFVIIDIISASIVKLAINSYLTMKITFANLIGDLSKKHKVDYVKVLQAIGKDKRINDCYLNYGFGYGGPCLPIDTIALGDTLSLAGMNKQLPELINQLNQEHLFFQVQEFKETNANKITIDGVSFREGTDILTHSQKLKFAEILAKEGYAVKIRECVSVIEKLKVLYGDNFTYEIRNNV